MIPLLEDVLIEGLVPTRSEARRMMRQGAVKVDGKPTLHIAEFLMPGEHVVTVGKRRKAEVAVSEHGDILCGT